MISSPPNLRNLLRLAFTEPVEWLTEQPDNDLNIHWVADSLDTVQAGDILIWPGTLLTPAVIAQTQDKNVSVLLLLGDKPESVEQLLDYPKVGVVRDQTTVRDTQQLLLTVLINQRAALMERGVRIHTQLSQLAAEGEGLRGIVRAMADISGRGVLVHDKRLEILTQQPSSALLSTWEDILEQLCTLELLPESFHDRKAAGRKPSIIAQESPGGLMRLIAPIVVGDVVRGYLSLVGLAIEFDVLDQLVIEQGALVCAVEMARVKSVREAEKRLKGDLLTALLQGNLVPRDARLWVQNMGLDLGQAHVAMRFSWDAPSPPSRRRLETLIHGEVSNLKKKVITSPMGIEVVCFCQVPTDTGRPEDALIFGEAVAAQGFEEYPEIPVRCGVGTPATDLGEWRRSFTQAGQALVMARRLGERKPLYFLDLSVYRLLFQIEHNPELIAFQEETLGSLLAHESADEFMRTLEAYFEHNGNLSQTAESLYIHRNTLIYRMERISEITGLNLDKPETRLAVQLAIHIFRMMGSSRDR
jgi:purine catabolism regulator